jgi:hypothetical protein
MKSPDNTEMDRLLRRYARRGGEALRASREQNNSAPEADNAVHLDADELNAYAEGALPENARSRYFSHLADCDACRKLVTDLTLAASLADEGKARVAATAVSPKRSWRDWLASIFSPPVLRYGVPALALFAIIIVAIVATRTQRESLSVAQNDKNEKSYVQSATANNNSPVQTTTTDTTAENHSNSNTGFPVEDQKPMQPGVVANPTPAKTGAIEKDMPVAPVIEADKPAPSPSGSANQILRESERTDRRAEDAVSVPAAQPPSPAESASNAETAANRDRREAEKKAKVAGKDDDETGFTPNTAGGAVSTKSEAKETRTDLGRATTTRNIQNLPATRKAPAAAPKSEAIDVAAQKERSEETRSVGGRKFRRQGSAWVDTAYKSSRSTTSVARGSEQYRSLVADEPELRAITQQLGGEVIVVWKSRAYRFY